MLRTGKRATQNLYEVFVSPDSIELNRCKIGSLLFTVCPRFVLKILREKQTNDVRILLDLSKAKKVEEKTK